MNCFICYDDKINMNTCVCNTCNNSICLKCYDKIIVRSDKYKYNYKCPFCNCINLKNIEQLPPRNIIDLLDSDYEIKNDKENSDELHFALEFYKNLSIVRLNSIQELKNQYEKSIVNEAINKCNLEVLNSENNKLKLGMEILNKKYKSIKSKYKSVLNNDCILNHESKQNII